jgi:2-polyprenyl-3-methyl-5-hydroxy-6-metoxy-1,4-benzoquinol methylase
MPTGNLAVAVRHIEIAASIRPVPKRVLDIGCGYGKYGVLLREYLDGLPRVDGVEAWQPYVKPHRLVGIYDDLYVTDALTLTEVFLDAYDLVNMADVIEHMEKQAGIDFLARCRGHVLLNTPVAFFHNGEGLPPTEDHVSHWTYDDFHATGRLQHHEEFIGGHIALLGPR